MHEPLVDRLAHRAGAAGGVDVALPLPRAALEEYLSEPTPPRRLTLRVVRPPDVGDHVVGPLLAARGLQELVDEAFVHAVVVHPAAVGAAVLPRHHRADVDEAGAPGDVAAVQPDEPHADRAEHRRVQGGLDVLSPASPFSCQQRQPNAHRAEESREVARHWEGTEHRPLDVIGRGKESRLRADGAVPPLRIALGVTLAVAGQRDVDQPRVDLRQGVVADAEAIGDTRPVVFDQHVRLTDHLPRPFESARRLEVEHNGAFAPVPRPEAGMCARRVAPGRLDLDDIRPLVGKQHPQQRPGNIPSELDDARASKGAGGAGQGHWGLRQSRCGSLTSERGGLQPSPWPCFGCPPG